MEWKLPNAKNRDVERQHLNKILAEIRGAISTTSKATATTTTSEVITRYAVARFMLTLAGDLTGSVEIDGLGDVTLTATLAGGTGLEEAPIDNQPYWRYNGAWSPVSEIVLNLQDTDGLPEGVANLYFTDERAQDAVAAALTNSASVLWTYNDVANTITAETLSAPNYVSFPNGDVIPLTRGMPVCVISGQIFLAKATAAKREVIGLVFEDSLAIGVTGRIQTDGLFTTTTPMWDAATGMVGGLGPEQIHYLTDTGELQPWPSTTAGNYMVPVGYAMNATTMRIELNTQVLL